MYPEKFIRDNFIAPLLQLFVVTVTPVHKGQKTNVKNKNKIKWTKKLKVNGTIIKHQIIITVFILILIQFFGLINVNKTFEI